MRTLIILTLLLLSVSLVKAQSISMENRFKNEVPGKEDTIAFRFKGKQLLSSLIEYARIYSNKEAYPEVVRNQAYQSARKLFADSPDFWFIDKGKQVKTDFNDFIEKLGTKNLNEKTVIGEPMAIIKTTDIGYVQGQGAGFSINATIALVKIKKQFGNEEEEVWEAVLSSANLKE